MSCHVQRKLAVLAVFAFRTINRIVEPQSLDVLPTVTPNQTQARLDATDNGINETANNS